MPSNPTSRAPERPFDAPWQAQLFGLTVALNEAGHFEWHEWAQVFGARLKAVGVVGNEPYYLAWLAAFQDFVVARGIASESEVLSLTAAWHAAAHATPHGQPIELQR